jgi:hypothetical protein
MLADEHSSGALDIRVLIANMVFWLRGDLRQKFSLFFYVYSSFTESSSVQSDHLCNHLDKVFKNYKEKFSQARTTCDAMNTDLDGKIKFTEFRNYCLYKPHEMDFICRLTLGPYPPS